MYISGAEVTIAPGADLRRANLRHADLRDANLRRANLRDADLRDADLWGVYLWRASLGDECPERGITAELIARAKA